MFTCDWAKALTQYDCQPFKAVDGGACLEIGTPFSLPGGCAINLYLLEAADGFVKISDNGDSLFQLSGMGIDVWQPARMAAARDLMAKHKLSIGRGGEIFILSKAEHAQNSLAIAITGLLALSTWAADQLQDVEPEADIFNELLKYIVARNPLAEYRLSPHVKGASSTDYTFQVQHGNDLIDVIKPTIQSTGLSMRKAGDILNGPFAEHLSPLFIVYDLKDPQKAENEISILGSVTRAVPASTLMRRIH